MEVTVQNRQRQYKINCKEIQIMAKRLAAATVVNLQKNKPKWLSKSQLKKMENSSLLSLVITSPRTIKKLNKLWLGKNKPTDVLSFPVSDMSEEIGTEEELPQLGEIFISYEKALEQAADYNHSLKRELAFLFVHGLLHVLGFDHQDKKSEKDMFGRQEQILLAAGYVRE